MTVSNTSQISGWFLSFSAKEMSFICKGLEEFGYTPDIEGLKKYIIDSMQPVDEPQEKQGAADRVLHQVEDFIKNNPESVNAYYNMGKSFINKYMNMNKKGRK